MTGRAVTIPAKLNLHLQVLGRRPDGMHELRTVFQSVDLTDELTAVRRPAGRLGLQVCPGGAVDSGPNNLVLRAARALLEAAGAEAGADLTLSKQIPVGGGLGGGSADAAAALVLLNDLWQLELDRADLASIGAGLGSDVPFFLTGGTALGVGRGEEVYPAPPLPACAFVVCAPEVEVATPEVYGALDRVGDWQPPDRRVHAWCAGSAGWPGWHALANDLQPVVCRDWPAVGEALESVRRAAGCRHAAVTGSGAAVFGVFRDFAAARAAARMVASDRRRAWAVRPLDRTGAALRSRPVGPT